MPGSGANIAQELGQDGSRILPGPITKRMIDEKPPSTLERSGVYAFLPVGRRNISELSLYIGIHTVDNG